MPTSYIRNIAKETNKSIGEVEHIWNKAKQIASENGEENNYSYITGIFKKILHLNEDTTSGDIAQVPSILGQKGKIKSFKEWYQEFKKAKKAINDKQSKK